MRRDSKASRSGQTDCSAQSARYIRSRASTAQAIRASLLASATPAGRRGDVFIPTGVTATFDPMGAMLSGAPAAIKLSVKATSIAMGSRLQQGAREGSS
jgi:hypothetical protein